jgi:hypothetical protein
MVLIYFCCFYKYNQIKKHWQNRVLQHIISGKFKDGYLFHYDKTFSEDKNLYKKVNVTFFYFFLSNLFLLVFLKFVVLWFLCFVWPFSQIKHATN